MGFIIVGPRWDHVIAAAGNTPAPMEFNLEGK